MLVRLLLVGIAAVALASSAGAADAARPGAGGQLYAGAGAGLAIFHDRDITSGGTATARYRRGLGVAGALGYRFNPGFRLEGELAYRKNDLVRVGTQSLSAAEMTVLSYGVNGYYDFIGVNLPVKPFLGLGLGYASGKLSGDGVNSKDSEFSYQGIAGVAYPFVPNGNITLQYRYQRSQDFSKDGVTVAYSSSTFLAGITYAFSL